MYVKVFCILAVIQVVYSQGITFQDGRLGVNFGGYNADVGFGPGGLSASAGTPSGQRAEAGLGGTVNGNTAGGLYAGATAGNGVGASASLGGDVNQGIGSGQAEAHAGGISKSVQKTVSTNVATSDTTSGNTVVVDQTPAVVVNENPVVVTQTQTQNQAQIQTQTQIQTQVESSSVPPARNPMVNYLPPSTVGSTSQSGIGMISQPNSGAASTDSDDNDLTDNVVPGTQTQTQTQTVVQPAKPVQPAVTVTTTAQAQPAVVNVQKIKVKTRPRPVQTYTVVQQPAPTVVKTVQYPAPVVAPQPVQITQYAIPQYQPTFFNKRIQISHTVPVIQKVVAQQEVVTQGPTTTTTSTTPRPPYVYTYDKNKVINEILTIPYHILNGVNSLIAAKLNGGYQVQKTVTYY